MRPLNRNVLSAIILFLFSFSVTAQKKTFQANKISNLYETALADNFSNFDTYQMDGKKLSKAFNKPDFNHTFRLEFGADYQWEFELYPADMFDEEAIIRILTEDGEMLHPVPRNISFKGNVKGNPQQQVSLLVHDDYIYGHITEGNQRTYIVSANRYLKTAAANHYLIFDSQDEVQNETGECGLDHYPEFNNQEERQHSHEQEEGDRSLTGLCYDIEIGIASDYLLYTDKGSTVQGAIDHVVGVMMDVETDYTTSDLDDAAEFEIVEQVISTCASCDPWTSSTSAGDFLTDLTSWVNDGGFNNSVDMAELWTDRDLMDQQ